jgi:hypothetical protein
MSDSKRTFGDADRGIPNTAGESESVALPRVTLKPARLLTREALRKAEASQVLSAMRGEQSASAHSVGSRSVSPSGSNPQFAQGPKPKQLLSKRPLAQASLDASEESSPATRPSYVTKKPRPSAAPTFGYSSDSSRRAPSEAKALSELQPVLKRALRALAPYAGRLLDPIYRFVRPLRRPQLNWKFAAFAAAGLAAFMVVDRPMIQNAYGVASGAVQPYVDQVKARAAFQIVDDFNGGVGEWWGDKGLVADQPGAVRVAGFSLHRDTMNLVSYRMDFETKIESRSVGWVVRAADHDTYYAFKLIESGKKDKTYKLVRYPVVDGAPAEDQKAEFDVPAELMKPEYQRISVRANDNQLVTFVNGYSIDVWRDARLPKGGVGFWVEKGESGRIRQLAVSGNEDFWGLTLYAAMETGSAVTNFVSTLLSDPSEVASGLQKGVGNLTDGVKQATPASWTN